MAIKNWEEFYAVGAETELKKVKEIIKSGETDPLRVINIFQDFNQRHTRSHSSDGEMVYTERPQEEGNLPTGKPVAITVNMMGKPTPFTPYAKITESRLIRDILRLNDYDYDAIVDLGAGWGRALFDLYYEGIPKHISMFSAEQSAPSRKITDTLAKLNPDIKIKTVPFDFRAPDLSFLKKKKKVFFYSIYSFMFVPVVGEDLMDAILNAAPHTECLHIEPFGHQFNREGPYLEPQRQLYARNGWNSNMAALLFHMQETGKLKMPWGVIPDILPSPYDPHNTATLFYWKKTA